MTTTTARDEHIAMVIWRDVFFLRERIWHHVNKAIAWQAHIDRMEAAADVEAPRRSKGRLMRRKGQELDPAYQVGAVLRDRTDYRNAVGNRNSHQAQVKVFSAALTALMLSGPPQLKDYETPAMEFFARLKEKSAEDVPA